MLSGSDNNFRRVLSGTAVAILLILSLSPPPCRGQYFGRNKVRYEKFNFRVIQTDNFKLYYQKDAYSATTDAARMLERWYARFSRIFDHRINEKQPVILYANHADFQQTNVIRGIISQGTGGVTEGMKRRMVIPFTGSYGENNHVLGHELVHAFQFDIAVELGGGARSAGRIPLWFMEGMPEYLTLGHGYPLTSMWMRDAVLRDEIPSIQEISRNSQYFPYRYGHAVWSYITSRWGDRAIRDLFRVSVKKGWKRGIEEVLNITVDSLSRDWKKQLKKQYRPTVEGRTLPDEVGRNIISGGMGMNLSPSVSPDGKRLAYFSRHDVFTLDLFLADAETGKIIDKLISTNSDAHFDALRFTGSSGTWSPDGSRFCFVVFEKGDNELAILEIESGEIVRQFPLEGVRAIHNVSWSPEGDRLAVSANSGGSSDLYIYNLRSGSTERITSDRFAELQPCWSPDGNRLAFITDRGGSTDISDLDLGHVIIGVMELETEDIRLISIPGSEKHTSPQFSPDGARLLFTANPGGFSDIFSYTLNGGGTSRLTNTATGVCGLTELSPALSVSSKTGKIFFNIFNRMEYRIHSLPAPQQDGEAESVFSAAGRRSGRGFPKPEEPGRIVDQYLHNPSRALPARREYESVDYDPDLKMVYAGMTTIGVTADRAGTSVSGGTSFLLSDMLGDYNVGITAYASGAVEDIGGEISYRDLKKRYNWGLLAGHLSYRSISSYTGLDTVEVDGRDILAREYNLITTRTFVDRGYLLAEYPLSRNRRLEFNAGYTRYSYETEVERYVTAGGYTIDHSTAEGPSPSALNLFRTSAAYVGDYSFFGFTSPARGLRYRFEVEPSFGSLRYLTATVDYRHYLFFRPLTVAARLMHIGRYLRDAENNRLPEMFLGNRTLVRGYSMGTFNLEDCGSDNGTEGCPRIDRLSGSRIGVLNMEVRLPLLGSDNYGVYSFPYLPTELSLFMDAGVAWTSEQYPEFKLDTDSDRRVPVFSAGAAVRINLANYLIAQFYGAYPFQRPGKGWQWGFLIAPGW